MSYVDETRQREERERLMRVVLIVCYTGSADEGAVRVRVAVWVDRRNDQKRRAT